MGLWDHDDISLRGLEAVRGADVVYLDCYTSRLTGTTPDGLETALGRKIIAIGRDGLEQDAERGILATSKDRDVVLLVGGDPLVSTTHIDLRLKAAGMGLETGVVHGASIQTAVCGLTGLQNYRFGRSATVTYPHRTTVSQAPIDAVRANLSIDAHTLLYLDINDQRGLMTISQAAELLMRAAKDCGWLEFRDSWAVGIARAGSPKPVVGTRHMYELGDLDWGEPLHVLVVPAPLHIVEVEALQQFGGAPGGLVEYSR